MLYNQFGFADLSVKAESGNVGFFKGYASTFDVDRGSDQVVPGAFGTINHKRVRMLWQHEQDKPIGAWSKIVEDKKGLYVEGKLVTSTRLGRETYDLMKAGAVSEMSIGYKAPITEPVTINNRKIRKLKKIELHEISVVSLAMNPESQIEEVKSLLRRQDNARHAELLTEREFERRLRDAGMSAKWSRILIAKGVGGIEAELEDMLADLANLSCKDATTVLDGGYRAYVKQASKSAYSQPRHRSDRSFDQKDFADQDDIDALHDSDTSDDDTTVHSRDASGAAHSEADKGSDAKSADLAVAKPIKLDPAFLAALDLMDA